MTYETLLNIFNNKKILIFKLYNIDYTIKQKKDYVEIKASYYEKRLHQFKSFDELMQNYTIYNEPLINQMNRIIVIDEQLQ